MIRGKGHGPYKPPQRLTAPRPFPFSAEAPRPKKNPLWNRELPVTARRVERDVND